MHSDFTLGYQVELDAEADKTEGEDDDSDDPSVTFMEWMKPGDSDDDENKETVKLPDSTVSDTVPAKRLKAEGLVPYVVSDTDDPSSQESSLKKKTDDAASASTNPSHFKTPSTADDLKKLSGKTFAESTDKKISWAVKLYMS